MTVRANSGTPAPGHRHAIELSSTMPESPHMSDLFSCEWRLVNTSDDAVTASFYLRAAPARLAALTCSRGRSLRGRHHASAIVLVPGGGQTTISALLELLAPGAHQIRVAVVTKNETHCLIDAITVELD
jgi:hypothetical protein